MCSPERFDCVQTHLIPGILFDMPMRLLGETAMFNCDAISTLATLTCMSPFHQIQAVISTGVAEVGRGLNDNYLKSNCSKIDMMLLQEGSS